MKLEICFTMKKENCLREGRATFYFDNWVPEKLPQKLKKCIEKLKEKINNEIKITSVHAWPRTPEEVKNSECVPVCGA